jgi:hypothetical protein
MPTLLPCSPYAWDDTTTQCHNPRSLTSLQSGSGVSESEIQVYVGSVM